MFNSTSISIITVHRSLQTNSISGSARIILEALVSGVLASFGYNASLKKQSLARIHNFHRRKSHVVFSRDFSTPIHRKIDFFYLEQDRIFRRYKDHYQRICRKSHWVCTVRSLCYSSRWYIGHFHHIGQGCSCKLKKKVIFENFQKNKEKSG